MAHYSGDTRDIERNLCPQRNEGAAGVCICYNVNAPCSALRRLCAWTVRPQFQFCTLFQRRLRIRRISTICSCGLRPCSLPRSESTARGSRKLNLAISRMSQRVGFSYYYTTTLLEVNNDCSWFTLGSNTAVWRRMCMFAEANRQDLG